MVSISYGHGHLNDCTTTTGYTKTDTGNTSTFTVEHGDYFKLNVTNAAAPKITTVVNDDDIDLDVGTDELHKKIRYRYRCSNNDIKAKILIEMDGGGGTQQTVLAETNSITWKVGTYTITGASDKLDHIFVYANGAEGIVYYDYIIVYEGDFTFPNGAYGIRGSIPNRNIFLEVPSRQTDITQMLGSKNFEFNIGCDLANSFWTKDGLAVHPTGTDYVKGQVFYEIAHNAKTEPWQWLITEREQMKVTLEPPSFIREASGDKLTDRLDLLFREYRLSDAGNGLETAISRWGLDL